MGCLRVRVKTGFGEVVIEGANTKEVLGLLGELSPEFLEKVSGLVSSRLTPPVRTQLEGVIEYTTEGPVVTARGKFTHYEAVGLVLYASEDKTSSAAQIDRLLQSSGVKAMVPARLNEMTKRGLVFKPDPGRSEFKLTVAGDKWIEETVIPKLRGEKG